MPLHTHRKADEEFLSVRPQFARAGVEGPLPHTGDPKAFRH